MTWRLFGGKGGVGKTTCAAAWAIARADAGQRVLLVSTDPAHALTDVFAARRRRRPARGAGASAHRPTRLMASRRGFVDGLEIDAPRAVAEWLELRRPAIARLLERGTLLDRDDVSRLLALPLPGLDELAAFLAMTAFERAGRYDAFVVDTAPTGHALRLLDLPRLVQTLAELFEAMHARHAAIAGALGGTVRPDALIDELRRDAAAVDARLHDPATTTFCWTTLPEPVAVEETRDGIDWLRRGRFPLRELIVNRLTLPGAARCAECRARARQERTALAPLAASARSLRLRVVPHEEVEPRGVKALRRIGAALERSVTWRGLTSRPRGRASVAGPARAARRSTPPQSAADDVVPARTRLVFFGGKGGVGKTTCAAATAVRLAARRTYRRVRLISTDPAPSLGDVLATRIGDAWRPIAGVPGLEARELDAAAVFDDYRRRYRAAIEAWFDELRGESAFDAPADRAVFERLFELAPPGVDEIMALLAVAGLADESDEDLLIVDTAPTGHTIRLLGLQADVQRWIALLMQLVIKYRLAGRAESFARDLVRFSRGLRGLRARLRDADRARFVVVTRAAALPRLETERLLQDLRRMHIPAPLVIVNAETGGTCPQCAARARAEQREVARLRLSCRERGRRCDIMHAPLQLPPPRGASALLEWSSRWHEEATRSPRRGSRS